MASSYPSGLDSFDAIASDKKTSDVVSGRTHRDMHNDLGDAIEAIQAELGTDPAGAVATVKARFEAIETNVGNLLTANQATGGDALGTADGFTTWNATVAYTGGRIVGTKTIAPGTGWGVAISPKAAVTPGQVYTIYAESERLTGAGISTTLWWSDASNNGLGGASVMSYTTATGVQTGQIVATAPANAAWAEVITYGSDADSIGATLAVHKVGVWRGAGGQWQPPGVPIPGTGIRPNPANTAEVQIWNDATATWITV